MNEKQIFEKMFNIAKNAKDPKGIVSACLVCEGEIVDIATSAEDGIDHAEKILLERNNFNNSEKLTLYSTLEPCSKRSNQNLRSCTDYIIESGIKKVVYAANDLSQHIATKQKFKENNITFIQTKNTKIIQKSQNLFNSSVEDVKDIKSF